MSGYIGNIPVPQATQTRQSFTATASQTTFNTAGYSVGYVDVFLNGVKLAPADYTATNGSDIILAVGAASGDILEIVAYEIFQVVDQDFTGDFTVDGTTFVVDSTNNRIGINTSSPSMTIDVDGSSGPNDVARFSGPNSGGLTFRNATANEFIMHTATSDALIFGTAGNNERMRIDSSGNIGIGAASPSSTFRTSIYGDGSSIIGGVEFRNAASGGSTFTIGHSSATSPSATLNVTDAANLIFKTNNTERMRIDSSGNLLVGTTDSNVSDNSGASNGGINIGTAGIKGVISAAAGQSVAYLNRLGSDGDIAVFRKDGSTVGSIGANGGDVYIGTGDTGVRFVDSLDCLLPLNTSTNATRDAAIDLGYNDGGRFKDLYLSGTAYVDTAIEVHAGNSLKMQNVAGNGFATIQNAGAGTNTDLGFSTAGSERMRIDSSGKVGINNSSPSYMLDTIAVSGVAPARLAAANGDAQMYLQYNTSTTGQFIGCNSSGKFQVQRGSDGTTMMSVSTDGYVTSTTAHQVGSQSTNLYNTGTGVGIFSDDAYGGCGSHIEVGTRASKGWASIYLQRRWQSGEDNRFLSFNVDPYSGSGSVVGTITHTGSSTSYNTSSDYRLKENITDVTDGITRVKQLAPKRFNFIANPDTTVDGFLAHEVQDVIPEAISGAKDAMRDEEYEVTPAVLDDDGNVVTEAVMGTRSVPDYQGIDQSKLVPLLTAALQEAIAKIETLETEMTSVKARLDALENPA